MMVGEVESASSSDEEGAGMNVQIVTSVRLGSSRLARSMA